MRIFYLLSVMCNLLLFVNCRMLDVGGWRLYVIGWRSEVVGYWLFLTLIILRLHHLTLSQINFVFVGFWVAGLIILQQTKLKIIFSDTSIKVQQILFCKLNENVARSSFIQCYFMLDYVPWLLGCWINRNCNKLSLALFLDSFNIA